MMKLWLGYIGWREGRGLGSGGVEADGGEGGVDEVVDVYAEAMEGVRRVLERKRGAGTEENGVYLLLRAVLFLKRAGFAERGLAILQASLELTFFRPAGLSGPQPGEPQSDFASRLLAGLEAFWESEVPRIGEPEARGWAAWSLSGPHLAVPPVKSQAVVDTPATNDPYLRWYAAETAAQVNGRRPTRITDVTVEDEEDPYSAVLFSDISSFLIVMESDSAKLQLIYAVLLFLDLPLTPAEADTNAAFISDPHLVISPSDVGRFWPSRGKGEVGDLWTQESPGELGDPTDCPVMCWAQGELSELFPSKGKRSFSLLDEREVKALDVGFCRNFFQLMRSRLFDPAFTASYLAVEFAANRKSALKVGKTLLSKERDNLSLWANYAAMVASQRGKAVDVRQIYVTCLTTDLKRDRADELDLFANWAEFEWSEGDRGRCLSVILASVTGDTGLLEHTLADGDVSSPSSSLMLRARQSFDTLSVPSPLPTVKLALLFEFYTNGIESTLTFIRRYVTHAMGSLTNVEPIFQFGCRLAYFRSEHAVVKPAIVREFLEEAITSFPNNTIFLSLYLAGEKTSRIYGRVQQMLHRKSVDSSSSSPVRDLWGIWAEGQMASRTFWTTNGAERVRTELNRAIADGSSKRCELVWKLFIEFEIHQRRFSAAKALCFRAVAELAGCKELYMMPFSPLLRPHFTPRELQDWAEVMVERGLRIRIPFERYFSANDLLQDDSDEEAKEIVGPDDELAFLQERKTLMPY